MAMPALKRWGFVWMHSSSAGLGVVCYVAFSSSPSGKKDLVTVGAFLCVPRFVVVLPHHVAPRVVTGGVAFVTVLVWAVECMSL